MNQIDSQYKKVINMYLKAAKRDFEDADTAEEKRMSLYLISELSSIINDVEVKGIGK